MRHLLAHGCHDNAAKLAVTSILKSFEEADFQQIEHLAEIDTTQSITALRQYFSISPAAAITSHHGPQTLQLENVS